MSLANPLIDSRTPNTSPELSIVQQRVVSGTGYESDGEGEKRGWGGMGWGVTVDMRDVVGE